MRKPLSEKHEASPEYEYTQANVLEIPKQLKEHFKKEGLASRWINASELSRTSGFHPHGWKPAKVDYDSMGFKDLTWGRSPEGHVVRGDCILAVRPQAIHNAHSAKNKQRARALKAAAESYGKESLRQTLDQYGGKEKIFEGDDDKE